MKGIVIGNRFIISKIGQPLVMYETIVLDFYTISTKITSKAQ